MTAQSMDRVKGVLESLPVRIGIVVGVLISLWASLAVGIDQRQLTRDQQRLTECLATYSEASNASQRARAEATEQDRKALDVMIAAVANARQLPAAQARAVVDAAFADYGKARAFADGSRSVSPIPEPPSAKC